ITKLEIKPDSEYFEWLEDFISLNFDYICTDDMSYFSRCSKAITRDGLVKNNSRHEKDDRPEVLRKENFVLGWDNKDKIKLQKELLKNIEKNLSEINSSLVTLEKKKRALSKEKEDLALFISIDDYETINWKKTAVEIQELEARKQELE